MSYLTYLEKGQIIVGTHTAGASIAKTAEMFGFSRVISISRAVIN